MLKLSRLANVWAEIKQIRGIPPPLLPLEVVGRGRETQLQNIGIR